MVAHACISGLEVGRCRNPRACIPARIAPELTRITSCPDLRSVAICLAQSRIRFSASPPRCAASRLLPILMTSLIKSLTASPTPSFLNPQTKLNRRPYPPKKSQGMTGRFFPGRKKGNHSENRPAPLAPQANQAFALIDPMPDRGCSGTGTAKFPTRSPGGSPTRQADLPRPRQRRELNHSRSL